MIGAFDFAARKLILSTSETKRSSDFISFLGRLNAIYGAVVQNKPFVLVLDNGPIHTSNASQAALAARPWLTVEWLPKYAPELNDIERAWRDLKRHFLAHHDDQQWARFQRFREENAFWLADYARYSVLRHRYSTAAWLAWPKEFAHREADALIRFEYL